LRERLAERDAVIGGGTLRHRAAMEQRAREVVDAATELRLLIGASAARDLLSTAIAVARRGGVDGLQFPIEVARQLVQEHQDDRPP